jgi:UDP-GlcNAc:undecaprenyl-phosphate GlcNAc-1-phosphate transferase
MTAYVSVYLGSFALAILTTPLVIRLADWTGAIDRPGVRTVHERPIPRIGGVAIFLSAMSMIVAVAFLNNSVGDAFRAVGMRWIWLLGSAALIFAIGLIDDLRGLPARVKFFVELLTAAGLCFVGIRISDVTLVDGWTLPLGGWGVGVTILWIVGITNAVNLSDGLDGLAAGICSIACGVIAIFAFQGGSVIMGILMLALLGSLCGFLVFNFHPAKIFMGDCGSLFLGFVIAASSVMCMTKSAALVGLALPALALGVPIFDTLFSMLRRFLERRSLFAPDRSHLHHRLLELGLNQRRAVLIIYMVTALATGLGLFMLTNDSISSLFVFAGALLLIVLVFRVAGVVQLHEVLTRLRQKYTSSRHERDERKVFEDRQLQFRQVRDESQWWQAVCQTASQMGFAWVSLRTTYEDGRMEEELWGVPQERSDMSRIVTVAIPLGKGSGRTGASQRLELAIRADSSLESAGRRATLFGRLIDECGARAGTQTMCLRPMPAPMSEQSARSSTQARGHA